MCPLDVQLPHAEMLVQCNTLYKNIKEKTQIKFFLKATQAKPIPILLKTPQLHAINKSMLSTQKYTIYWELCAFSKRHMFLFCLMTNRACCSWTDILTFQTNVLSQTLNSLLSKWISMVSQPLKNIKCE